MMWIRLTMFIMPVGIGKTLRRSLELLFIVPVQAVRKFVTNLALCELLHLAQKVLCLTQTSPESRTGTLEPQNRGRLVAVSGAAVAVWLASFLAAKPAAATTSQIGAVVWPVVG